MQSSVARKSVWLFRPQTRCISRSAQCLHTELINSAPDVKKLSVTVELQAKVGEKVALCRCWKSAKFPYCDGAHTAYNKAKGDSVGPAIIVVAAAKSN